MNIEKRALLDHAQRCRSVADDLAHREAARRLRAMADVYEARAAGLDDEDGSPEPDRHERSRLADTGDRQN
ncbi:hypothetical protein WI560_12630 [Bradyrhizobium sp. A11]|jgi:hypothetical protein|uniref:Uncharacterized protein n=1 Tax=Bradyrhizobium betae TaxID=244734 RepID=A0AAE9SS03_9BRAD|nr:MULTISPECIES: hypothetical protein [Bradyrhizobium]MDD1573340.1 hypothetical protein [Bradyrhizobium sp. WBOS1]UUO37625.1 hypothetical protein DCK84_25630 [Bradyrhizobium sp. WBOS01]MDD1528178.1 hypothetical protein [Bradyrhizobium sp. WBOS2]MDD1578758.1 hypothetical protein [Bradyrhizobium sp. WBOS7]MDD1602191.1 hypothetical protein [Bradyrhizobium sp. WBOS16]